ncbi:hypothetical protein LZ32DRAFT_330054 [Colletotrichum eremochloae]|nr:hypothetical protein LZ32DRAFT_330054 [Colletotrichum eremochloae]
MVARFLYWRTWRFISAVGGSVCINFLRRPREKNKISICRNCVPSLPQSCPSLPSSSPSDPSRRILSLLFHCVLRASRVVLERPLASPSCHPTSHYQGQPGRGGRESRESRRRGIEQFRTAMQVTYEILAIVSVWGCRFQQRGWLEGLDGGRGIVQ